MAQSKKYDQAKEKLAEVLTVDSANAITYRYLLLISLDENNKEKSWSYWNKLAAIDPEDKETWFLKGVTEKRYNELDSAGKTFEWIVREKDSLHFRSLIVLASISILKGYNKATDMNLDRKRVR